MENDDFFFEAYLIHKDGKNKRSIKRRKDMNPKVRGSECAVALKRVHDSDCSIYESNLKKTKTKNGKEIRGFRIIHPLYLESVQEVFEAERQEREDERDFFDYDFDFEVDKDWWQDYATEESRRQMTEAETDPIYMDGQCLWDYEDYEDLREHQEEILL